MRRVFLLALGMLICAAGIGIAAARLVPQEPNVAGDELKITVLRGGEPIETTLSDWLPGVVNLAALDLNHARQDLSCGMWDLVP